MFATLIYLLHVCAAYGQASSLKSTVASGTGVLPSTHLATYIDPELPADALAAARAVSLYDAFSAEGGLPWWRAGPQVPAASSPAPLPMTEVTADGTCMN